MGIIQVLDMKVEDKGYTLTKNCLSWFPATVNIDFHQPDRHTVKIDLPVTGPNMYNPFFLITKYFVFSSLLIAKKWGYEPLKKDLGGAYSVNLLMKKWPKKNHVRYQSFEEDQRTKLV